MKIVYVYPLDVPHPAVAQPAEMGSRSGFHLSVVGVVEPDVVEDCISQYAERSDDRAQAYLVVDAQEFIVDPVVKEIR